VLGFGTGNIKDSTLETLADKGNGNYAYIDTLNEARKVLVEELGGTLVTVAKDVKIQIEFNPGEVQGYRLIGYENRLLKHQEFNDDAKDAGDMGAGHTVTALFEVVPAGAHFQFSAVDALKYQPDRSGDHHGRTAEMLNIKIRYKEPALEVSQLMEIPVVDRNMMFDSATDDFRFAAAVASFGMILRDSPHKGNSTMAEVIRIAEAGRGLDRSGYRDQFIRLVESAGALKD
jgi:Ca-activated chloride channel family protein